MRAPGVRLDPGGIAKGMAADLAAASLPAGVRYAISCGGDLAVGGERPWDVAVRSARNESRGPPAARALRRRRDLRHRRADLATEDGRYAHHVLDPATGRPAWTGLVAVTAVAGSALEAEVLAKAALLSGPLGARRLLRRRGGVLQHDDGRVEIVRRPPSCGCRAPSRREHRPARLSVLAREPLGRRGRLRCCSARSVVLGLAMATRLAPVRDVRVLHERIALLALGAVGRPRAAAAPGQLAAAKLSEVLIPFTTGYRPLWTGLGILAAYGAVGLSLTYYARRRLGHRRWRNAHRFIPIAWALAAAHVIGAGTDVVSLWLQVVLAATIAAIVVLIVQRGLAGMTQPAGREPARAGGGTAGTEPAPLEPAPARPPEPERMPELGLFRAD